MPLSNFEKTADIGVIVEALRRDGAVVVNDLAESSLVDAIRAELRPQFDAHGLKACSDFNGSLSKESRCPLLAVFRPWSCEFEYRLSGSSENFTLPVEWANAKRKGVTDMVKLPPLLDRILCWLGFHDFRVVSKTPGFGTDGVEKDENHLSGSVLNCR